MVPASLRLALLHTNLSRDGPGLLLRDIRRGQADVIAVQGLIASEAPDILLLLDVDHDHDGLAVTALTHGLAEAGHALPHHLAPRPNSGRMTALDLDRDGRLGGPGDALGWGRFAGDGGMVLLSRFPLELVRDHTNQLWRDTPAPRLPVDDRGHLVLPDDVLNILPLPSVGAWEVAVHVPGGPPLTVMAWHAGPPVFGGPHRQNWLRNAQENALWIARLNGLMGPPPLPPFVLMGDANLDPERGDGDHAVIRTLLDHPALQDPRPTTPARVEAPGATANWPDGPGALRVDYILPSRDLNVLNRTLAWPSPQAPHAMVVTEIAWPPD